MRLPLAAALALLAACASGPTPRQREAADIHTSLGVEALRAGRAQEALKEFEIALEADPDHAEAILGKGILLEFQYGRRDEAEAAYRRAIALSPNLSAAHNNLGQLLAGKGRREEALAEFDAALGNMHYAEPYAARYNKGRVLGELGRREEALAELKLCVGLAPRYCPCHLEQGKLLLEGGKVKDALGALQRATQLCDKDAPSWHQLGLGQLRAGAVEPAREAFARCEELAGPSDLGTECRTRREALH